MVIVDVGEGGGAGRGGRGMMMLVVAHVVIVGVQSSIIIRGKGGYLFVGFVWPVIHGWGEGLRAEILYYFAILHLVII